MSPGPDRPWAQWTLGPNGTWAQTGPGPNRALGPNRAWAQTGPGPKRVLRPMGPGPNGHWDVVIIQDCLLPGPHALTGLDHGSGQHFAGKLVVLDPPPSNKHMPWSSGAHVAWLGYERLWAHVPRAHGPMGLGCERPWALGPRLGYQGRGPCICACCGPVVFWGPSLRLYSGLGR